MKKQIAVLTAAALLAALTACAKEEPKSVETEAPQAAVVESQPATEAAVDAATEATEKIEELQLGTSCVTMTVFGDFVKQDMTKEDTDENMVAYYANPDMQLDFDVYHWALASDETLESAAKEEAAEYGAEVFQTEVNGMPLYGYEAVEEYEGTEYKTLTVLVEDEGYVVEIVFWLDGDNAMEIAQELYGTLTKHDCPAAAEGDIRLGTSSLTIHPEHPFVPGEMLRADTDEVQVGYFYSEECTLDFDVYHWAKATGETLADAAAEEAAEYEAELQETDIGGHKVFCYTAVEESDGVEYTTLTCITEDGDYLVEIVFWLDGEDAAAEAEAILATLK